MKEFIKELLKIAKVQGFTLVIDKIIYGPKNASLNRKRITLSITDTEIDIYKKIVEKFAEYNQSDKRNPDKIIFEYPTIVENLLTEFETSENSVRFI